jgi:hypothetical protein
MDYLPWPFQDAYPGRVAYQPDATTLPFARALAEGPSTPLGEGTMEPIQ